MSPQCGKGVFPPESASCADFLIIMSVQPPCAVAAISLFGHMKILHTPIGMDITALAVAVPYPGKVIQISLRGESVLKNENKNIHGQCTSCWDI